MDELLYSEMERLHREMVKDPSASCLEDICNNSTFTRFLHEPKNLIQNGFYTMLSLSGRLSSRMAPKKKNCFSLFDNDEEESNHVLVPDDVSPEEIETLAQLLAVPSIVLIPFYNRCMDNEFKLMLGLCEHSTWFSCFSKSYFACRKSGFSILLSLLRHCVCLIPSLSRRRIMNGCSPFSNMRSKTGCYCVCLTTSATAWIA